MASITWIIASVEKALRKTYGYAGIEALSPA